MLMPVSILSTALVARQRQGAPCARLDLMRFGTARSFDMFRELHERWCQYMHDLQMGARSLEDRLLSADLHGSYLRVVKCREKHVQGAVGIMFKTCGSNMYMITAEERVHRISKVGAIVEYSLGSKSVATTVRLDWT